jgi:hypothetical protein
MISATMTIGTIAISWAIPALNLYQSTAGIYYQQRSDVLKESFIIEDVWFDSTASPRYINVTLRNVGSVEVKVIAIYINSTIFTTGASTFPTVPVGQRSAPIKISITNPQWTFVAGKSYLIVVATARGNQVVLKAGI